jgi:regulator of replication initiation timing
MKVKLLSQKSQKGSILRRFGTTAAAIILALLLSKSSTAQTIFSNPVGINVGAVAAGKDLHVNGPLRFDNLSGVGVRAVTADANGDLSTVALGVAVPAGTSLGQSLLWDGTAWQNNDFLKVPNFTGGPEVFEVGNTGAIDFVRTIHYGGNVALDLLPGTLGNPTGTWMSHGWRAPGNSLPAGDNFTGTRVNWQDFAGTFGLTDRSGGPEIDLNIQARDFTVPAGDPLTNRIIFSGSSGPAGGGIVQEFATILGNGFMGVGTPNPDVKFQVQDGRIAQVSQGNLSPPIPGNRWSALGDRLPFAGGPGIISTGLRTQWDEAAINVGLTPDPTGTVPFSGLISWQDATAANPPNTGDNSLIFGARDNTNTNFFERMRITWDGNVGIGTPTPTARLQVEGGNAIIAQVSQGILGPPAVGNRWSAIGDRQPFAGGPGIISTGLRAQWDNFAANYGLTQDAVTGTIAGLISWQDANGPPNTGNNPLIFGARDNTTTNFFERMRITWDGNVGIGTPNPFSKVEIVGNSATTGTSSLNVLNSGGTSQLFVRDDGMVGINTTLALIPVGTFSTLPAGAPAPAFADINLSVRGDITQINGDFVTQGAVYAVSDVRFKKDLQEFTQADWKKILNVKAFSYRFDQTKLDNVEVDDRLQYGFKAQDVNAEIPELTKQWGEAYVVNYQGFVPFLTAGIQDHEERLNAIEANTGEAAVEVMSALKADMEEMAKENEALRNENKAVLERLEKLEAQLSGICSLPCVQEAINQNKQEGTLNDQPQLYQNEPNPFGSSTTIKYYVPANAASASIKVVDNSGKQLGEYKLKTGKGQLEISAGTIPAGTYNYSLYVDNNIVDTKKMVIVNY